MPCEKFDYRVRNRNAVLLLASIKRNPMTSVCETPNTTNSSTEYDRYTSPETTKIKSTVVDTVGAMSIIPDTKK